MSTIEKAAARLRSRPVAKPMQEPVAQPGQPHALDEHALDDRVASTEHHELTCELNLPYLADNGFIVPGHQNAVQAREFRRIKRPLLLNLQPAIARDLERLPNSILITSALPGEGKTFVSLNLALSLAAELDKSVLLIDGDAAKGDLSRWMGIHDHPGLVDILSSGRTDAESVVLDTNLERLQVMSCGKSVDNLDELYASQLMDKVMHSLCAPNPNRILVIDAPPLIATTEAAVLARQSGQVVMIVEANKTPQSAVEEAAQQLEGCQLVSMMLNKATGSGNVGYGYGYGYGYGESSSVPDPQARDSSDAA